MKRGRACPDCGSPACGNPCWYFIKNPEASPQGADPPCYEYFYDDEQAEKRSQRLRRWRRAIFVMVLLVVCAIAWAAFGHEGYPAS